jgi:hypothetical protein
MNLGGGELGHAGHWSHRRAAAAAPPDKRRLTSARAQAGDGEAGFDLFAERTARPLPPVCAVERILQAKAAAAAMVADAAFAAAAAASAAARVRRRASPGERGCAATARTTCRRTAPGRLP